jgi:hypothetical protein
MDLLHTCLFDVSCCVRCSYFAWQLKMSCHLHNCSGVCEKHCTPNEAPYWTSSIYIILLEQFTLIQLLRCILFFVKLAHPSLRSHTPTTGHSDKTFSSMSHLIYLFFKNRFQYYAPPSTQSLTYSVYMKNFNQNFYTFHIFPRVQLFQTVTFRAPKTHCESYVKTTHYKSAR